MDKKLQIWMNFQKKDLKQGDDFTGQLIYEGIEDMECNDPLFDLYEEGCVKINIGFGLIKVPKEYFLQELRTIIDTEIKIKGIK